MNKKFDLTEGSVLDKLLLIALPVLGAQIMQMAYNLTDMFWLGRVGADAVAASGTVGMFVWMSQAFMMYGRMGAEIGVSQNQGRDDIDGARRYGETSFFLSVALGISFGAFLFFFRRPLIGFFNIEEINVVNESAAYLAIISAGIPFTFMTNAATGVFNGAGNSQTPFLINGIGLAVNMVLDPVLILRLGMGVPGAAIATVAAQGITALVFILALKFYPKRPFEKFRLAARPSKTALKMIFYWATPIAMESFLFTFLSMFISKFVSEFGAKAIATQRIGTQVESLSWLIAGGFATALTAYIGQNFGGGKWERIHKGFRIALGVMTVWGAMITTALFFGAEFFFRIFLPDDPVVVQMGVEYLRILSVSQAGMCLEGVSAGAFRGLGKTVYPSVASVVTNFTRVFVAYYLSRPHVLGLNGIWWAFSLGGCVRGLWMLVWYLRASKRFQKNL